MTFKSPRIQPEKQNTKVGSVGSVSKIWFDESNSKILQKANTCFIEMLKANHREDEGVVFTHTLFFPKSLHLSRHGCEPGWDSRWGWVDCMTLILQYKCASFFENRAFYLLQMVQYLAEISFMVFFLLPDLYHKSRTLYNNNCVSWPVRNTPCWFVYFSKFPNHLHLNNTLM